MEMGVKVSKDKGTEHSKMKEHSRPYLDEKWLEVSWSRALVAP